MYTIQKFKSIFVHASYFWNGKYLVCFIGLEIMSVRIEADLNVGMELAYLFYYDVTVSKIAHTMVMMKSNAVSI